MENKIRILKVLETIHKANSKIEGKRLEHLINTSLFSTENDEPLWARELLKRLDEMKGIELIFQDEEKKYSITQKGLDYLKQHS